jgi:integrase
VKPSLGSFLNISQAAKKLGVTPKTIREWCQSGRLPAIAKAYGHKTTYLISPQAIELVLLSKEQAVLTAQEQAKFSIKPHSSLTDAWENSMARGLINGRAFSQETIKDYRYYIDRFFEKHKTINASTLKAELAKIPAHQIAKRQHCYKAIVCMGKFLIAEGQLEDAFLKEVKNLYPKRHLPPKRSTIKEDELEKLLQACESGEECLIVSLLAFTGLRASEACGLKWEDIDLKGNSIRVQLGKGGKERKVGISARLKDVIEKYYVECKKVKPECFLLKNTVGKPMTRNGLYQRLERIGINAGVKVSPHALRRAFVTLNANKGRSLVMLQHACGHNKITTTRSYCLTTEQEVIEAMKDWD